MPGPGVPKVRDKVAFANPTALEWQQPRSPPGSGAQTNPIPLRPGQESFEAENPSFLVKYKIPWPFFNPKPPALTSINRRKSTTNPGIASINVC